MKTLRTTPKLKALKLRIETCNRCPRLRNYCKKIAQEKRKSYLEETYWGKPVSGFGDPEARILIVGLAPAAHGANRTGRIFTGDRSGDWLFRALHKAGLASQPSSMRIDDGLELHDVWVTCTVRCAPPGNKPEPQEYKNCRPFLHEEMDLLSKTTRVYIALGGVALQALQKYFTEKELVREKVKWKFAHGAKYQLKDDRFVLVSFHPSQQNTFTKRLTEPMFDSIFRDALMRLAPQELRKP